MAAVVEVKWSGGAPRPLRAGRASCCDLWRASSVSVCYSRRMWRPNVALAGRITSGPRSRCVDHPHRAVAVDAGDHAHVRPGLPGVEATTERDAPLIGVVPNDAAPHPRAVTAARRTRPRTDGGQRRRWRPHPPFDGVVQRLIAADRRTRGSTGCASTPGRARIPIGPVRPPPTGASTSGASAVQTRPVSTHPQPQPL